MGLPTFGTSPVSLPLLDLSAFPGKGCPFLKGIPAKLGTPAQDIVLSPWAGLDDTWIYDVGSYHDSNAPENDNIYNAHAGNLFKRNQSSTYREYNAVDDIGAQYEQAHLKRSYLREGELDSTGPGGTDNLQATGSSLLKDFPFNIARPVRDYCRLHPFGLGSNSTYINALRGTGGITSRVWSLFWGRAWIDEPIDGSIVLGGYDEDKAAGQSYTAPLVYDDESSTGCWTGMKVELSDIRLNFRDGRDISLVHANTTLAVCLVPQRQLLLEAPDEYILNFEALTKTKSLELPSDTQNQFRVYNAEEAFDGDITFSLTSGLDILVPNSQYMVPFVNTDRKQSPTTSNTTHELLIQSTSNQLATLGGYFFTSAYLMVNHDAGTFTLWKANPTRTSKLVQVLGDDTFTGCDKNQESSLTPRGEAQNPVSGGVIGGAVAGSVAGLAIIALVIFFIIRHQRRSNVKVPAVSAFDDLPRASSRTKIPDEPVEMSPIKGRQRPPSEVYNVPQELYGSEPVSHERRASPIVVFELDASERRW
ncbi:unnamed protein product [Clonostachys rosea]|uniref:Peptidase A1 domain-containing protein n=1 Tax=Bionectria ochroleuca TaxID=29856 RepID=A0ABY6UA89_BIOOC|nr:unnamed protein product [Clonostachys rosea]